MVYRCKEARRVDQVVVAIPDTEDCDILLSYVGGATVVRGPEFDVLKRYQLAAETVGADVIVRVTSDCPLIRPNLIDEVIDRRRDYGLAYACNNMPDTWPLGYAVEAFTKFALRWHAENSWDASSREHVTTALRNSVAGAQHVNVPCGIADFSHLRRTLDTIDDYVTIVGVMSRSGRTEAVDVDLAGQYI